MYSDKHIRRYINKLYKGNFKVFGKIGDCKSFLDGQTKLVICQKGQYNKLSKKAKIILGDCIHYSSKLDFTIFSI